MKDMLPVSKLNLGFLDAENYRRRENMDLFNDLFLLTPETDKLCRKNIFFLVGEKGTGKTAYAVYLCNNSYGGISGTIRNIQQTDYQKFISLKQKEHLCLADYTDIWKVIIYLLLAQDVVESQPRAHVFGNILKLRNLRKAIQEYHLKAFAPEVIHALRFIENSEAAAKLVLKHLSVEGGKSVSTSYSESRFQTNLLDMQRTFEDTLRALRLDQDRVLFIDGIDVRPPLVDFEDYLNCVRGLAMAVWLVNNEVFSQMDPSRARLRVVLVTRPDTFHDLGLHNPSAKIRDNSVLLDWRTTLRGSRESSLFAVGDRLLAHGQRAPLALGKTWDYYFPFIITDGRTGARRGEGSFAPCVKLSFHRPRDVVRMLNLLKDHFPRQHRSLNDTFSERDFLNYDFRRDFSNYLLGEVRDQLSFRYSSDECQVFIDFFGYLEGFMRFDYNRLCQAYLGLCNYLAQNNIERPKFMASPGTLLQLLYDLNVLGYTEDVGGRWMQRWCFRERTLSNISPKIKVGSRLKYQVHTGMGRALGLGRWQ